MQHAFPIASGSLSAGEVVLLVVGILVFVGAILFTVFWLALIGPLRQQRRLLGAGEPASAIVRSAGSTGTRVGGRTMVRVELDVTDASGTHPATCRMLFDPAVDARLEPGTRVAVRVDPDDRSRVAIDRTASARDG